MATVEVTVKVSIRQEGMSLEQIKDAVGELWNRRDLLSRAYQVLEKGLLEREPALGGVQVQPLCGAASGAPLTYSPASAGSG